MCCYLIFADDDFVDVQADDVFGSKAVLIVLLVAQGFFAFGSFFSFGTLGVFHVKLNYQGYGTYLYLVKSRTNRQSRAAERASRMDFEQETMREKCNKCCGFCPEKEDAASRMTIEVSRVESAVVKDNMLTGSHKKYNVDLEDGKYNEATASSKEIKQVDKEKETNDEINSETKEEADDEVKAEEEPKTEEKNEKNKEKENEKEEVEEEENIHAATFETSVPREDKTKDLV